MSNNSMVPYFLLSRYHKDPETRDMALLYQHYGMTVNYRLGPIPKNLLRERAEHLMEEAAEVLAAVEEENLDSLIDGLVDLVVLAKGTAAIMGLEWTPHWEEVLLANSRKEMGKNPKRPDHPEDLIKPEGWIPPNHVGILEASLRDGEELPDVFKK